MLKHNELPTAKEMLGNTGNITENEVVNTIISLLVNEMEKESSKGLTTVEQTLRYSKYWGSDPLESKSNLYDEVVSILEDKGYTVSYIEKVEKDEFSEEDVRKVKVVVSWDSPTK